MFELEILFLVAFYIDCINKILLTRMSCEELKRTEKDVKEPLRRHTEENKRKK